MAEEQVEQVEESTSKPKQQKEAGSEAAPELDVATIAEQAAASAVKKILDEQSKSGSTTVESITKADIEAALENQRSQISNAISGKTNESQVNPVLEELIKDPNKVFGILQDIQRQEMQEYVNNVIGQQQEAKTAGRDVLSSRPDVVNDTSNQELFSLFYGQTDQTASTRERLKTALTKYDLHMEKRGEGTVKSRVAKASSVSSASASTSKTPKDNKKTESEILNEELAERQKRRKAQRALFQ